MSIIKHSGASEPVPGLEACPRIPVLDRQYDMINDLCAGISSALQRLEIICDDLNPTLVDNKKTSDKQPSPENCGKLSRNQVSLENCHHELSYLHDIIQRLENTL